MSILPINLIEATPGACGGKPRIAGHRIRVQDVVEWHEHQAMSPDEIVAAFPQLSLAKVYAALAYYHDHMDEIRAQMEADEELVAEMRPKSPSKLIQKLSLLRQPSDSGSAE
jgi:uncharacterized protein (DUF433 family)